MNQGMRRALLGLVLVLIALTIVLSVADRPPSFDGADIFLLLFAAMAGGLGVIGFLIVGKQPGNAVGWLFMLSGISVAASSVAFEWIALSRDHFDLTLPGTILAAWLNTWLMVPTVVSMAFLVPLLFPTGRLPSSRWRPVGALAVFVIVGTTLAAATAPGPMGSIGIDDPFAVQLSEGIAPLVSLGGVVLGVSASVLTVAAVIWRYRRGTTTERLQLRWFAYPALLAIVGIGLSAIDDSGPIGTIGWMGGLVCIALIPAAIGIAITRYRLYEIDRIISRTIGWALVTGLLVAVFALGVVGLQALLAGFTQGQTLAVAASTLVAAALFQPLRSRIQRAVDRRFDRARYDGARIVDAFGGRLRDEVDLGRIRTETIASVDGALSPSQVGVWLRRQR